VGQRKSQKSGLGGVVVHGFRFKEESIQIDLNRKCIECAELVGLKRLKKNPNFYRCEPCQQKFETTAK